MNKNLKKVISAASALAVSATGVAAFAADYPDVPNTASYYQAVNELSALNVINGYDDGTFKPEENVTRAQIAKMVVTSLGNTVANAADSAAGKDTQFTDVPGSHWAAGYIAVATTSAAQNFINGYSATTFGPEDNVTYAQAIKMLVCALGYDSLAQSAGGWPSGYLKYGYSLGLTTGLSNINNDQQLNRSQVAVLIDNALKAPIAVAGTNVLGQATVVIKDGTGDLDGTKDGYQNLLNYAHDAYLVYGRVTGTFKTGDCDSDEVRFQIEKSDNWDGYSLNAAKGESVDPQVIKKGSVDNADDLLFTYAQAILQKDSNDEYTLVAITKYGSSEKVELETSDFKEASVDEAPYQIKMYKDANQSKYDTYKFATDDNGNLTTQLYVNGQSLGTITKENIDKYIDNNNVGTLTLVDETQTGKSSTDGKYDYVMVSYYLTGVVDEVVTEGEEDTIYFDSNDSAMGATEFTVDNDDEDKSYSIKLDGKDIKASEIQPDDVVSIAYDVTANGVDDSNSYTILVSRNKVEAQLNSIYEDKSSATGNEYTFNDNNTYKLSYADADGASSLEAGSSYTLYLDAFGKIAKVDELASSKKYAFVDNIYTGNDGTGYVRIITPEGKKIEYSVKDKDLSDFTKLKDKIDSAYANTSLSKAKQLETAVIEYSVDTKGNITLKNDSSEISEIKAIDGEFKINSSKIGSAKIAESYTSIIDLSDYDTSNRDKYSSVAYNELSDGTSYEGIAVGKSSDTYQFIIVTNGLGGFNVADDMAVFVQKSNVNTDDGNKEAVIAYVGNELKTVVLSEDGLADDLSAGDTFFYTTDSDNYIDEIKVVTSGLSNYESYQKFYLAELSARFDTVDEQTSKDFENKSVFHVSGKNSDTKNHLIAGPIVNVSGSDVTIASKAAMDAIGATTENCAIDDLDDYSLSSDANVYVYDFSVSKAKDRVSASRPAAVRASTFTNGSYVGDKDDNVVDFTNEWNDIISADNANYGRTYFAVAKVCDDEITDIVVIKPDTSKK